MKAAQNIVYYQKELTFRKLKRGCHLVTSQIESELPEIKTISTGLLNLLLMHTSASLCVNENYDPDVRVDMETTLNRIVPEGSGLYTHTSEGKDDMPAHVKTALLGVSVTLPITGGKLNLGTWQGVWLCEHRDGTHDRTIMATVHGASSLPPK